MNIIYNKKKAFVKIKGHIFYVLNGFQKNNRIIFLQCISDTGHGIIKEYLPKGYSLTKKRINNRMFYNISNNNYFKYNSMAETAPPMLFIAPTDNDGAQYLAIKYILENAGIEETEDSISGVKKIIYYDWAREINKKQTLSAIIVYDIFETIEEIRGIYEK